MSPSGLRGCTRGLVLIGSVLLAALIAGSVPRAGAEPLVREGGTLRVNITGTDLSSLDPAINHDADGAQILYATCAKLLTYPDREEPRGSLLEPEVATGMPTVSRSGLAYTFEVSQSFRFSNGARVRAADFAYTLRRVLDGRMHSPASGFLGDIAAFSADGNTLTVKLRQPAPDFLARVAMPFLCVVPSGTPIRAGGADTIPSAGPYYVASRKPGVSVTLKRNPYYSGRRPHHVDEIDFTAFRNGPQSVREVENGTVDYDLHGVPGDLRRKVALKYGVNGSRLFVHPVVETRYVALNTRQGPFRDVSMRKAVAYAIDRLVLTNAMGFLGGNATDQILPPAMPGWHNVKLYPFKADLRAARKLMGGRKGTAVLYTSDNPTQVAVATLIVRELARIGIDLTVQEYPLADFEHRVHRQTEPFDMALNAWSADYLDPYDFINILLSGKNIPTLENQNLSGYNDPKFNRQMDAAAALSGDTRYAAYAKLDADLMREAVPIIPYANEYRVEFVSRRLGCVVLAPGAGGLDLAAACLK
jgi:ABC-type transport system substrate-binding protein